VLGALFGTRLNAVITLVMLWMFWQTIPGFVSWAFGHAVWEAANRAACAAADSGACWAFIKARFALFFYSVYPEEERWRVHAGLLVLAVFAVGALFSRRHRAWFLIGVLTVVPVVDAILLAGGVFGLAPVPTNKWGGMMLNVVISFVALRGVDSDRHPARVRAALALPGDQGAVDRDDRVLARGAAAGGAVHGAGAAAAVPARRHDDRQSAAALDRDDDLQRAPTWPRRSAAASRGCRQGRSRRPVRWGCMSCR
jgi:hypothetical protein